MQGDNSIGEFYSVALTNNYQQADTGTKMIHIGKNTKSTIISKGISAGHGGLQAHGIIRNATPCFWAISAVRIRSLILR
jgi:Fe-S cluster assembly protein SufB